MYEFVCSFTTKTFAIKSMISTCGEQQIACNVGILLIGYFQHSTPERDVMDQSKSLIRYCRNIDDQFHLKHTKLIKIICFRIYDLCECSESKGLCKYAVHIIWNESHYYNKLLKNLS